MINPVQSPDYQDTESHSSLLVQDYQFFYGKLLSEDCNYIQFTPPAFRFQAIFSPCPSESSAENLGKEKQNVPRFLLTIFHLWNIFSLKKYTKEVDLKK
ncbi:Uncharacterized protein dnm_001600 [Desulfonema magnum]|uniref:Uncharacterized protein n=1 Tax=Desulfonema magnum TaxID=45655 RepID=A0A975BEZ4_9BACT|nr:Uncharacterized protein dnm_001600 [Desulfonema magnum]